MKRGSTNALLQKVNSQLRGERVKKENDEDDDLNNYLKSLAQKTSQQKKSVNFEDVGDISISSELNSNSSTKQVPLVPSNNKFLKKKTPENASRPAPQSKFLRKPQVSGSSPIPTVSSQPRPGTSRGTYQRQTVTPGGQKSASLDKAAALSTKIAQRQTATRNVLTLETDSDETYNTPRGTTPRSNGRPGSASSDSFKIGRDKGKFLKKKPVELEPAPSEGKSPAFHGKPEVQKGSAVVRAQTQPSQKKGSPFVLRSSQRYSTDVVLSSEEESLADFITGLEADSSEDAKIQEYMKRIKTNENLKKRIPSPPPRRTPSPDSKPPTARRTPSPLTPRRANSPKTGRRSPSPKFRRSLSRSSDDSILSENIVSEIIEEQGESEAQSVSSGDGFKSDGEEVNLMDADSLEPVEFGVQPIIATKSVTPRKSRDKSKKNRQNKKEIKTKKNKWKKKDDNKKNDDIFGSLGLHSVDELFGDINALDFKEGPPSVASEASEIQTQSEKSEVNRKQENVGVFKAKNSKEENVGVFRTKQTKVDIDVPVFGSRTKPADVSVSEIVSEIPTGRKHDSYTEDFESSISERIGIGSKASKLKSVSEIRTRNSSEETMDEYTERFDSDTESIATVSRTSETSEKTVQDSYTSYSESHTYSRSPAPVTKPTETKVSMKSVEVQTSAPGLTYQWDPRYVGLASTQQFGLGFVDPTPIATHVVSPDALEAMTAYTPCMLALHDMLKQQLMLTREFLQSQQYLYRTTVDSIDPQHHYTTLQATKAYIKKHRKKKLTFKEALKLVDAEMDR